MVRHSRSSITHPHLLSYYVPNDTALQVISKHLDYLLDKERLIVDQMVVMESKGKDTYEIELMVKQDIINQIHLLKKVKDKISSTESRPLCVVAEQLHDLHQKQTLISEAEGYLCLGISPLSKQLKEALLSKRDVLHQIDMLKKIFKEISLVQLPLTGGYRGREVDGYQLPPLLMCLRKFRGFADISGHGESFRRCDTVRNLKFRVIAQEKETREVINWVESESLYNQRYLCVTNGFEIFFLDPKQRKDQTFIIADDVPSLPKIATLKLWERRLLLASVGLFRWRSNVYMICGKVPKSMVEVDPSNIHDSGMRKWTDNFEKLYEGGSTCDIYCLIPAGDDLIISRSEFIPKLNKPKFWPIVENIDGQIHLIDSLPESLLDCCHIWSFSHEVLNPDSGSWTKISSPIESVLYIREHLVVGNRIFAISPVDLYFEDYSERSYLEFDSNKMEWERSQLHRDLYSVWDILELGRTTRCVGGFPYGQPNDLLYVIIALQSDKIGAKKNGTQAVAYLVTSMGHVVCIQVLRNFFTGPVWPCRMIEGKLIQVEGKTTMCSIVRASAWDHWNDSTLEYVFINTFSVKELTHVVSQVRQLREQGSKAWPVVQDFVSVDIKDKCIYRRDRESEEGDSRNWIGVQACFL